MKWLTKKRFAKASLSLLIVVAVVGFVVSSSKIRSRSALNSYKAQLRAAGEKLTIAELVPPRVPPEQNGVVLLREAMAALSSDSYLSILENEAASPMLQISPGKATVRWRQPHVHSFSGTNSWEEVEFCLGQYALSRACLQQLIDYPAIDFGFNYQQVFSRDESPHLSLYKAGRFLSAATVNDLHRGDVPTAFTDSRALLAIIKGSKEFRTLPFQRMRCLRTQYAHNVTWELLQSPDLTDPQLALLQRDWTGLEFVSVMENALLMHRAAGEIWFATLRGTNAPLAVVLHTSSSPAPSGWRENLKSTWQNTRRKAAETTWRVNLSYNDELQLLKGYQVLIEAARQVRTNGCFNEALLEKDRKLKALGFVWTPHTNNWDWFWKIDNSDLRHYLSHEIAISSSEGALNYFMKAEVLKQLAITAIALKRYQLQHGRYPATLDALVPDFLPSLPRDPVDGKTIRYRLNPDGDFLLYSIGENGKDDGGDPNPDRTRFHMEWLEVRDIVWPQVATEQEIENYFRTLKRPGL